MKKDELEEYVLNDKIRKEVKREFKICGGFIMSGALAISATLHMMGSFIYSHWEPIKKITDAAIKLLSEAQK